MNLDHEPAMNLPHSHSSVITPPLHEAQAAAPVPSGYRDGERKPRQPGTGYGKSSGYGQSHHYADQRERPLFRCG